MGDLVRVLESRLMVNFGGLALRGGLRGSGCFCCCCSEMYVELLVVKEWNHAGSLGWKGPNELFTYM